MAEIISSETGTSYITFGDDIRQYQLLESQGIGEENNRAFELRVDNDPNQTFAEYSITVEPGSTKEQIFAAGIDQAKTEIEHNMEGLEPDLYLEGQKHLLAQLEAVGKEFEEVEDFAQAVGGISGPDATIEQ